MKKTEVKKSAKPTIRTYKKRQKPFLLRGLREDGTFKQSRGKPLSFTIHDVIRLKKLIPQVEEYPNFIVLSEEMGLPHKTTIRLAYLIETGKMDKWLNKWEQMEANNFYGKYGEWKPNFENNPQKRKEQGMV